MDWFTGATGPKKPISHSIPQNECIIHYNSQATQNYNDMFDDWFQLVLGRWFRIWHQLSGFRDNWSQSCKNPFRLFWRPCTTNMVGPKIIPMHIIHTSILHNPHCWIVYKGKCELVGLKNYLYNSYKVDFNNSLICFWNYYFKKLFSAILKSLWNCLLRTLKSLNHRFRRQYVPW